MSSREGGDQLFQASLPQVSRGRPPRAILPFSPQQARQNAVQGHISLVSLVHTNKIVTRVTIRFIEISALSFFILKVVQKRHLDPNFDTMHI